MKLPRTPFAWTLGARRSVYENPWMDIQLIDAVDPSGQTTDYGLVHFKNLAIAVVPYADDHIWIVGQSRVGFESYSWEVPAGGGNLSDPPAHAAARELKEETGFTAQTLTPIVHMEMSNSVTDERGIIFLATGLTPGETAFESSEDISLRKISLDAAIAAVDAGEIRHALGVAAIYKLALMRAAGELDGL